MERLKIGSVLLLVAVAGCGGAGAGPDGGGGSGGGKGKQQRTSDIDTLASRRGYERISRPGTLEEYARRVRFARCG